MAKETGSWTRRLGGNRTLVLVVMVSLLVLFTVDTYIVPALGGGSRGGDHVRFTVNGRAVVLDQGEYQSRLSDWQRFQSGQAMFTGRLRGGREDFLMDVMLSELARDAGLAVTDATLRDFIRIMPLFSDSSGEFDHGKFEESLKEHFGGLRPKAFEEQARFSLLVTHFVSLYDQAYRVVGDDEAYRKWKSDYPKIGVVYAWSGASSLRAGMKLEDLEAGAVEGYWKNPAVQDRHRLAPRYLFEALALRTDREEFDDQAYRDALVAWKDDPDLLPKSDKGADEAYAFFAEGRNNDFAIAGQTPEVQAELRAENEARVKEEDEAIRKGEPGAVPGPGAPAPGTDLSKVPPEQLDEREVYRRYWRFRVEKEVWLRKLFRKIVKVATESKAPLEEVAEKFSRPGIRIRSLVQDEPVDQYGVEKLKGFGSPNCDLRYVLNEKKAEDEGKVHPEVLPLSAVRPALKDRGWLVFRLTKRLPDDVPPLETVREKVALELLDDRARDRARSVLEDLRKAAEDARKPLDVVAKEKGLETESAPSFNAYSWRPPSPKPFPTDGGPGETPVAAPVAAEGWKDPARRLSAVMGRYAALRDTPVGTLGPVLDDVFGTGAFYLAEVKTREDPRFEEMNQGQLSQAKRVLGRERLGLIARELTYGGLKNRLGLLIDGQPAPEPEEVRRGR